MYEDILNGIRRAQAFKTDKIPLHAPVFRGNERKYVLDAIDSTFVSSVGAYVDRFEEMLQEITGAKRAVACCNGTCALEMALRLAGVGSGDAVLTQPLSFVATANAISHIGAQPVFVDIDLESLALSPEALEIFLARECELVGSQCRIIKTGQRVGACVPMHTFGMPAQMNELLEICERWNVPLVEDAAEALGSYYMGRHCGTLGRLGTLSFNGNKTVTTGGGGAILTNDEELGKLAKHLTTTARLPHAWRYRHDSVGWNYRMPNLNAALGCAQLEQLEDFIRIKRERARRYADFFSGTDWTFLGEPAYGKANYWLCAVLLPQGHDKEAFLGEANAAGLGSRPVWDPLPNLDMYKDCVCAPIPNTLAIAKRLVNLPSGVEDWV